jgi:hypothetical protein
MARTGLAARTASGQPGFARLGHLRLSRTFPGKTRH